MFSGSKTTFMALAAAILAAPAMAGGVAEPAPAPMPVAPASPAYDWSGLYLGAHLLHLEPIGFSDNGFYDDDPWEDRSAVGLFAGYNAQDGAFVYGGELAFTHYDSGNENFPGEVLEHFVELRGRVGYAIDNVLIYGALGLSSQNWTNGGDDVPLHGYTAGLGVDYALTDNWFAGAEFAYRELDNEETGGFADDQIIVRERSVRLRIGYRF